VTATGRPRSNPRRISVLAVQRLSPRMRRVTFGGSDLASFVWSGPAAHIKIIFPEPVRARQRRAPTRRGASMRPRSRWTSTSHFTVMVRHRSGRHKLGSASNS